MIVLVAMVVVVVVVAVVVFVIMAMIVLVIVMMMMVVTVVVVAVMGAHFGLEAALDRRCGAALPARQFRESRTVLDIEGVAGDLRKAVLAAEMPCEAHEAERVFGSHLEKAARRGRTWTSLPSSSRRASPSLMVVSMSRSRWISVPASPSRCAWRRLRWRVVERDRVDHAVGLHGGLADDGADAGHGISRG